MCFTGKLWAWKLTDQLKLQGLNLLGCDLVNPEKTQRTTIAITSMAKGWWAVFGFSSCLTEKLNTYTLTKWQNFKRVVSDLRLICGSQNSQMWLMQDVCLRYHHSIRERIKGRNLKPCLTGYELRGHLYQSSQRKRGLHTTTHTNVGSMPCDHTAAVLVVGRLNLSA